MAASDQALTALADLLATRRQRLMSDWRAALEADSTLTTGSALPRAQLNDHIPTLLDSFEAQLRQPGDEVPPGEAAAHGLHRWQQGFGLAEVSRELGQLNECVVAEIDACAQLTPAPSPQALAQARKLWAHIFSQSVSASTSQYVKLQQLEAASYVKELELALRTLRTLERQRAAVWQQAAHDLRGNLGVVANVAAGLGYPNLDGSGRDHFMRMLERNMDSLHKLLDDFTSLARLQGGQEQRRLETVDVAALLTEMGGDLRHFATTQGLSLELIGPPGFSVEGDAVKIQRVVQNLVLNAIRYTTEGGVKVSWGPAGQADPERWALEVEDTGPGFAPSPGSDVIDVLQTATDNSRETTPAGAGESALVSARDAEVPEPRCLQGDAQGKGGLVGQGEGIGLSIVKRLCELLDATIHVESGSTGTRFRILLPLQYPPEPAGDTPADT